jgi:gamma-glutamylcyclotransferase (GGCT)/AIG2-like uncharacterized protein YtfP
MSNPTTNPLYHIFVYGTLKPGQPSFETLCAPYVEAAVAAIAPGRLYDLPAGYPAITLEPGWVWGWRLSFRDPAALAQLDAFEDCDPACPKTSEYQRLIRPIYQPPQGEPVPSAAALTSLGQAWAYVMSRPRVVQMGGRWLPTGRWPAGQSND